MDSCGLFLFPVTFDRKDGEMMDGKKTLTPLKAIRAKCLDCVCGQANEVKLCPCTDCNLYPYRFGKNPNIRMTDEQKARRAANLRKNAHAVGE